MLKGGACKGRYHRPEGISTERLQRPLERDEAEGHGNDGKDREEDYVSLDRLHPGALEEKRPHGVHRVCLRVHPREGLEPARKALDRVYGAAREKEYDVQESAEHADYPRVVYAPHDNERQPLEAERREDYDDDEEYEAHRRHKLPDVEA